MRMASSGGVATTILDAAGTVARDGFGLAGVIGGPQDSVQVVNSIQHTNADYLVPWICELHHRVV